jgi:hypothetical protein
MTDPTGDEAQQQQQPAGSTKALKSTPSSPTSAQSRGSSNNANKPTGAATAGSRSRSMKQQKNTMNGPLYMQTSKKKNVVLVRRTKRKDEGTFRLLARLFVENQIGRDHPSFFAVGGVDGSDVRVLPLERAWSFGMEGQKAVPICKA